MDWSFIQTGIVLVLVVIVFFGFIREVLSPDVVALSAVSILLISGILSPDDALSVFSNSAPITVGAMFVLSAALERTGVISALGQFLSRAAGKTPHIAVGSLLLSVAFTSAFVNNTPIVVLMTPVVIGLAQTLKTAPSKLLIPLSFASIFGGMTTLIGTSTNILVDGVAQEHGIKPIGMFEITEMGAILGVCGLAYLFFIGRWLLPRRETLASLLPKAEDRHFVTDVLIPIDSPLIGKPLSEAGFTEDKGFRVIDVIRRDVSLGWRMKDLALAAGDRLVIRSKMGDMLGLREAGDVKFGSRDSHAIEPIAARETVIVEGVVGPRSRSSGRHIGDLNLMRLYGAFILAVHRQGENITGNFDQLRLRVGDTLLLEGPPESIRDLFEAQELINLTEPDARPFRRNKAPIAIGAIAGVMVLATLNVLPIAALAIVAATTVVALGCVKPQEAYESIQWNILMLIFGMLALGIAMDKTGAAQLVIDLFASSVSGLGPVAVLSALYLTTSILTEMMSNNATAILMTPIAIGLADQMGLDARPFIVAVMFAASASFSSPIGYQTNTFVYNAGGYRFIDFLKVGVPLNLMFWALSTFFIPQLWPLH
ncbi:MAG TPA: SLC13 family permease [Alphaproteobacteria bacterium]|nr:SLC13 family permease [Alphaproteobacteria bacterium]